MLTLILTMTAAFAADSHGGGEHHQQGAHQEQGNQTRPASHAQYATHANHSGHMQVSRHPAPPRRHYAPPSRRAPIIVHTTARPAVIVHRQAPPARPETHAVSLTLSAVHLIAPMPAINAEFRLAPKLSIGVTGGLGVADEQGLVELGGQLRAYPVGNFDRGLFLGGAARLTNVPFYEPEPLSTALSGFVGGKYTFAVPVTLEVAAGPQIAHHEGWTAMGVDARVNIGFSF